MAGRLLAQAVATELEVLEASGLVVLHTWRGTRGAKALDRGVHNPEAPSCEKRNPATCGRGGVARPVLCHAWFFFFLKKFFFFFCFASDLKTQI